MERRQETYNRVYRERFGVSPRRAEGFHPDHAKGEPCVICDADKKPLFPNQVLIRETDTMVWTRPEGIEPGKLEIGYLKSRRNHPAGKDR